MKIHEQLHVILNILFYGAHRNVHTGSQEHNHIQNTKKPSKQVQRNKRTFDWELGNRLVDKHIINSACQKFAASHEENSKPNLNLDGDGSKISPSLSKFTFKLSLKNNVQDVKAVYNWKTPSNKANPLTQPILKALVNHFGDKIYNQPMMGFSELKHNNVLYWATAEYRTRGCWYDNAMIAWVDKQSGTSLVDEHDFVLIPSELRLFFKFEQEKELYCIVHSCEYTSNQNSILSVTWKKEYLSHSSMLTKEPVYHVISCDSIDSHCLLLPYDFGAEYVLQILHSNVWADEFLPS